MSLFRQTARVVAPALRPVVGARAGSSVPAAAAAATHAPTAHFNAAPTLELPDLEAVPLRERLFYEDLAGCSWRGNGALPFGTGRRFGRVGFWAVYGAFVAFGLGFPFWVIEKQVGPLREQARQNQAAEAAEDDE
ncbi:hypothetical protein CXG81DRAFT_28823 [Caulochytrium protostelioides]|uniref:Uncharacterized protein n=1 Tax=Caulochytrium protostelioides TaxID=1555241 RepID=A0A4P9X0R5_9FUNG|nr:hypothetical protein CXG81DRAFT_28823 [Caulochytrium protostelioides]|eukprot:RKO98333.1 hypothetical protein CXG81DRAFT_28823 [Caulochytrium protostelioides]